MTGILKFGEFIIQPVHLKLEINYIVSLSSKYFCRIVPGQWGLELSILDKAIGNQPDENLIAGISDFIIQKDA